jgi:hypothetical protein
MMKHFGIQFRQEGDLTDEFRQKIVQFFEKNKCYVDFVLTINQMDWKQLDEMSKHDLAEQFNRETGLFAMTKTGEIKPEFVAWLKQKGYLNVDGDDE